MLRFRVTDYLTDEVYAEGFKTKLAAVDWIRKHNKHGYRLKIEYYFKED